MMNKYLITAIAIILIIVSFYSGWQFGKCKTISVPVNEFKPQGYVLPADKVIISKDSLLALLKSRGAKKAIIKYITKYVDKPTEPVREVDNGTPVVVNDYEPGVPAVEMYEADTSVTFQNHHDKLKAKVRVNVKDRFVGGAFINDYHVTEFVVSYNESFWDRFRIGIGAAATYSQGKLYAGPSIGLFYTFNLFGGL